MTKSWVAVFAGLLYLVQISCGQDVSTSLTAVMSSSLDTTAFISGTSAITISTGLPTATVAFTSSIAPSPTLGPTPSTTPTSQPIPTTSGTPTPTPTPTTEFFYRNDNDTDNGTVCAHVVATMGLSITYKKENEKESVTRFISINNLSPRVDPSLSYCDDDNVNMTLTFHNDSQFDHTITFSFSQNDKKTYKLDEIVVYLELTDSSLFPKYNSGNDSVTGKTQEKGGIFTQDDKKSYYCKSRLRFDMHTGGVLGENALTLELSHFTAQAFQFTNDTSGKFDDYSRCPQDRSSSKVVPIAVGAALAGLVVVVLIAYLIGRFRSRKQNSYEALS